jgi:hypothetical protein
MVPLTNCDHDESSPYNTVRMYTTNSGPAKWGGGVVAVSHVYAMEGEN